MNIAEKAVKQNEIVELNRIKKRDPLRSLFFINPKSYRFRVVSTRKPDPSHENEWRYP